MKQFSIVALIMAFLIAPCHSAELRIIGLAGMTPLMKELGPAFERATGHKLLTRFGSGADGRKLIEAGEPFDVAVLNPSLIKAFIEQGKIASGTGRELFRNGTGVVVRVGAPKPDIATPEAFKRAILAARSIAYSPGRASGIHVEKVLAQLGISEEVKAKTKAQQRPELVAKAVAGGEAEIGFAAMNLLIGVDGAAVIGPFPALLQEYIVFTAGVGAGAKEVEAGRAFIAFMQSEAARSVMRAQGLEPL